MFLSPFAHNTFCIDPDRHLWAFGCNKCKKLGADVPRRKTQPGMVDSWPSLVYIASAKNFTVGLTDSEEVWYAGAISREIVERIPKKMETLSNIIKIGVGSSHCVALDDKRSLWGFGRRHHGALGLGDGAKERLFHPRRIPFHANIEEIRCGVSSTFLLDDGNGIWVSGANFGGEFGLGHWTEIHSFEKLPGLNDVSLFEAGNRFILLKNKDTLMICGAGVAVNVITGKDKNSTFTPIPHLRDIRQIAVGKGHCLAVDIHGNMWGWGDNRFMQLDGSTNSTISCTKPLRGQVQEVRAGRKHSLFIDDQGSIWASGGNQRSALGILSRERAIPPFQHPRFSPDQIPCRSIPIPVIKSATTMHDQ